MKQRKQGNGHPTFPGFLHLNLKQPQKQAPLAEKSVQASQKKEVKPRPPAEAALPQAAKWKIKKPPAKKLRQSALPLGELPKTQKKPRNHGTQQYIAHASFTTLRAAVDGKIERKAPPIQEGFAMHVEPNWMASFELIQKRLQRKRKLKGEILSLQNIPEKFKGIIPYPNSLMAERAHAIKLIDWADERLHSQKPQKIPTHSPAGVAKDQGINLAYLKWLNRLLAMHGIGPTHPKLEFDPKLKKKISQY